MNRVKKGDKCLYIKDNKKYIVIIKDICFNVPKDEDPEISIIMPDGNIRDTEKKNLFYLKRLI